MKWINAVREKIKDTSALSRWLAISRFHSRKIVFTNGCFDILHKGHIEYLAKAAAMGDLLVVGLNSDSSVKILKGESRPLLDQSSRALALASIQFVSCVTIFDEETPYELIKLIQPDILVKGGDYKPGEIVGYDIVKAGKGKVIVVDLVEGYSSTTVINKLKES